MSRPQKEFDPKKLDEVEELLGERGKDGSPLTHKEIARQMDISTKTVQRYADELERLGRKAKRQIVSQAARDEAFDRIDDTYGVLMRAIRRTEKLQNLWEKEINFTGDWQSDPEKGCCPTCGRPPLRTSDALNFTAAFKGGDTLNNQITTLMKALGQIQDNPLLVIQQQDEDLMVIIEELSKIGRYVGQLPEAEQEQLRPQQVLDMIARAIFNRSVERSTRRKIRLPEFMQVVEGEYKLLGPGE